MTPITSDEKMLRQSLVASALGTHAMEGLYPDSATLQILRRYESGQVTLDQFSAEMEAHANVLAAGQVSLAGAA